MSSEEQNNAEESESQRMFTMFLSRLDRLTTLVDSQGQTIQQLQGERNTGLGRGTGVKSPTVGVSESPGEPSRLVASGESQPPASAPSSQEDGPSIYLAPFCGGSFYLRGPSISQTSYKCRIKIETW